MLQFPSSVQIRLESCGLRITVSIQGAPAAEAAMARKGKAASPASPMAGSLRAAFCKAAVATEGESMAALRLAGGQEPALSPDAAAERKNILWYCVKFCCVYVAKGQ